jgi:hypothetical protein
MGITGRPKSKSVQISHPSAQKERALCEFTPETAELNEQRLWDELDARMAEIDLSSKRAILIGCERSLLNELAVHIAKLGLGLTASISDLRALSDCPDFFRGFNIVIVNLDAFADVSIGIEEMLSFRKANPTPAVVLISSKATGDDIDGYRRAICDATLALPLTRSRLMYGIRAALENNRKHRTTNSIPSRSVL